MKRQFSGAGVEDFSQSTMPYSKKSRTSAKRYGKKRTTLSRKPKSLQTVKYMRDFNPFPATMVARLTYSAIVDIDANTTTPGYHLFRANGIFDPDYTSTGHQPYGRDTYASIYNHYRVLKSNCSMISTLAANIIYGVSMKDDVTVETNFNTIREAKGTNFVACQDRAASKYAKNSFNTDYYPNKNNQDAPMGASPGDPMFYQCWCEGVSTSANPAVTPFMITIVYDVLFWELQDLGQS